MKFDEKFLLELMDDEGKLMLGDRYKDLFSVGDYVEWRSISRNKNHEETIKNHCGIITNLRPITVGGRDVWYADVMKNGGSPYLVLISKIRKVETN